mgnify:CR=1 FL=1|jgi:hypothetical protein
MTSKELVEFCMGVVVVKSVVMTLNVKHTQTNLIIIRVN